MSKEQKIQKNRISKIEDSIEENEKLLSIIASDRDDIIILLEKLESREYNLEMENENLSW